MRSIRRHLIVLALATSLGALGLALGAPFGGADVALAKGGGGGGGGGGGKGGGGGGGGGRGEGGWGGGGGGRPRRGWWRRGSRLERRAHQRIAFQRRPL